MTRTKFALILVVLVLAFSSLAHAWLAAVVNAVAIGARVATTVGVYHGGKTAVQAVLGKSVAEAIKGVALGAPVGIALGHIAWNKMNATTGERDAKTFAAQIDQESRPYLPDDWEYVPAPTGGHVVLPPPAMPSHLAMVPSSMLKLRVVSGGSAGYFNNEWTTVDAAGAWLADVLSCISARYGSYNCDALKSANRWAQSGYRDAWVNAGRPYPAKMPVGMVGYVFEYQGCTPFTTAIDFGGYQSYCQPKFNRRAVRDSDGVVSGSPISYVNTDIQVYGTVHPVCHDGYSKDGNTCNRTDDELARATIPLENDGVCNLMREFGGWLALDIDMDCPENMSKVSVMPEVNAPDGVGGGVYLADRADKRDPALPPEALSPVDIVKATPLPEAGTTKAETTEVRPVVNNDNRVTNHITNHITNYYPGIKEGTTNPTIPTASNPTVPTPLPQNITVNPTPPADVVVNVSPPVVNVNVEPPDFKISPGDPGKDVPTDSPLKDIFADLPGKAIFPVSSQCPADAFGWTLPGGDLFGDVQLTDGGVFCSMLSQYQENIRLLCIAMGWITAMLIIVRDN